jgi:predicted permease
VEAIIFIMVKIVGLCAVGYILRSRDIVTIDFSKQLTAFLISVVTPFAILSSGNLQYSEKIASDLLTTVFFMLGYFIITIGLMTLGSLFIHADRKMKGVFINLSIFASVTFIGFPVLNQIYATEGTLIIVTANLVFNLFLYSYGVNNFNSKQGFSIKGC